MEDIGVEDLLRHYLSRINYVLDELQKSEKLLKDVQILAQQELKGAFAESMQDKVEECSDYVKKASENVEIAWNRINALSVTAIEE